MGERALAGIRVCDLSGQLAGAGATRFLAAFGAQVIRVEDPVRKGGWDILRGSRRRASHHRQAIRAVVVISEGAQPTADVLAAWCRDALAAYKVPTQWEIRHEALPRNASGKVLKRELEQSWAC